MLRYTFYFAVALLAFGIGLFVVSKFYYKHTKQFVITQTTETNKSENKEQTLTSNQEISQDEELNKEQKAESAN